MSVIERRDGQDYEAWFTWYPSTHRRAGCTVEVVTRQAYRRLSILHQGAVEAGAALYAALRDGHSLGDEAVHNAMARWEALDPQPPRGQ